MSSSRPFTYMQLANLEHIEDLHRQFLSDPESLDASWRYFFEGMAFGEFEKLRMAPAELIADLRIYNLIDAYRRFGHLEAHINPIAVFPPDPAHELSLTSLGFTEDELEKNFPSCGLLDRPEALLSEIIAVLKKIYCGSKGIEYMGRHGPEMEKWVQQQIEPNHFEPDFSVEEKHALLDRLNEAELFETFLHTKYVGQKRFSLEGGETLIPVLAEIVDQGGELGMKEFVIGMAHRGRLNVLANILHKSLSMIFGEFEDFYDPDSVESAGDVKYHKGFTADVETRFGKKIHISVTANPSHLESVDAVVQGKVRAKQMAHHDEAREKIIPILIHGDSSVAGQGVVYETLQLYDVNGYGNGGTLHIVLNNQIGFTTLPIEYRSSHYSTDIAHAFGFPVFHVNAEDPEGCILATRMAIALRNRFKIDVFINLNCYRKYGHNEGDEPFFTQPLEYQIIQKKKSIRELYRDHLIKEGVVEREIALELEETFRKGLHYELEEMKLKKEVVSQEAFSGVWEEYHKPSKAELLNPVLTAVEAPLLKEIGERFCAVPEGFEIHSKLKRLLETRRKMSQGEMPIDWAMGEHFAFGLLLWEGHHVRLSGQDSQRGTFTQRHCVWVDQKTGARHSSLSCLKQEQGIFSVYNSILSEFAVLGFEFGYSLAYPSALVCWEAQFGDFANGGQIIFDQYISASEQKWNRYSGLVTLLPHGYEGGGSEHSSARLERFLQLAAESNIQVVHPSTPAQYFHLLRRQVKRLVRVPLIVLTPKMLLRYPKCVSSLEDLSKGTFQEVLDDPEGNREATRLLLCSGKVYYDLIAEREKLNKGHIAILRIEQLYPLHHDKLVQLLGKYKAAKEIFWVQEEPRNMGAYTYMYPILHEILPKDVSFQYVGRNRSASPAAGSRALHLKEQEQLMKMAFDAEAL